MKTNNLIHSMWQITKFALPISIGGVVNALASFISMMMVARLGKESIAAAALAISTFFTIITVSATIFYSVSILISHRLAQNEITAEIGLIVKNSFWIAVLLSLPAGLGFWYADNLLLFFKQDPQLVALTKVYFHFAAISMLPFLGCAVISQFYAGISKPRFTLFISLISLPLTIITAYGFVLGNFRLPKLGLGGIACSNLVVQITILCILLVIIYFQENNKYQIFSKPFLPNWEVSKSILALGVPIGAQFGSEFIAITAATYMLGHFGATALAASQITSQYYIIIIVLFIGLTQSLSIFISKAFGNNNYKLIYENLYGAIAVLMTCCVFTSILFIGFPKELIKLYIGGAKNLDAHLENLTTIFFILSALLLVIDGLRHLLAGALRGLQDSHGPMRISIVGLWFFSLPICYLIGFVLHGGPIGLRVGFLSGFIFSVVLLSMRLYKKLISDTK